MEISDPVPEMIIPVTSGKRTLELRLRTRAECRDLIRAAALASSKLPEDGEGGLMLLSDSVKHVVPRPAPGYTIHSAPGGQGRGAVVAALTAAPTMAALRALLMDAWEYCPDAVERAILDAPAAGAAPEHGDDGYCGKQYRTASGEMDWCAEPAGHEGDCGDQPRNVLFPPAPFPPQEATLAEAEADVPPQCPATAGEGRYRCDLTAGHEGLHHEYSDDNDIDWADGRNPEGRALLPVTGRDVLLSALADDASDAREDADPGYLEDAAAQDDDEAGDPFLGHGEPGPCPSTCIIVASSPLQGLRSCLGTAGHPERHHVERDGERWEWDGNLRLFGPFYPDAVAAPVAASAVTGSAS